MSILHAILFRAIQRGKTVYDPAHPTDYVGKRAKMDHTTPQTVPMGVTVTKIDNDAVHGEYLSMAGNQKDAVILYIHGGGFVVGSTRTVRPMTGQIVKRMGMNVLSINYRLAPEHPYPAAHQDCMAAYRWLLRQPFGKRVIIMGESAGGNLILGTVLHAKAEGLPLPKCVVALAPTIQYDQVFPSYTENLKTDCMVSNLSEETRAVYLCSNEPEKLRDPYFAPYYGDYSDFPPTLIIASDSEVLRDDAIRLHEKLQAARVPGKLSMYHNLMHTFPVIPALPESKKAYREIRDFITQYGKE